MEQLPRETDRAVLRQAAEKVAELMRQCQEKSCSKQAASGCGYCEDHAPISSSEGEEQQTERKQETPRAKAMREKQIKRKQKEQTKIDAQEKRAQELREKRKNKRQKK